MLTHTQEKVLKAIHAAIVERKRSPSIRELAHATGAASTSQIHEALIRLAERGFIRRLPDRARAIEIIRLPQSMGGVCPTCGK